MCPFASATSAGALPRRALNRCHVGLPAIVGLHVGSGALTHQKLRDGEVTIQSREMKSYATSKLSMPCVLRSNLAESPAFFVSLGFHGGSLKLNESFTASSKLLGLPAIYGL